MAGNRRSIDSVGVDVYSSFGRCGLLLAALITTGAFCSLGAASAVAEVQPRSADQLREALDAMTRIPMERDANRPLLDLPAEEVIPTIIDALERGEQFSPEFHVARERLYSVLARRYGAQEFDDSQQLSEMSYQQLFAGLSEPNYSIKQSCATALAVAPDGLKDKTAAAIGSALREAVLELRAANDDGKGRAVLFVTVAIRSLSILGLPTAEPYLKDFWNLFRDRMATKSVRSAALHALIRLEGFNVVFEQIGGIDPVGLGAVMGPIGSRGMETKGTYGGDDAFRAKIRQFVLTGLSSEERDTRNGALEAIRPAFWEDLFVIRSRHDCELNPSVRKALARMAVEDPDEGLRQRAAAFLDPVNIDRNVENILRKREREADKARPDLDRAAPKEPE